MRIDGLLHIIKMIGLTIVMLGGGAVGAAAALVAGRPTARLTGWRSVCATGPAGLILIATGGMADGGSALAGLIMWGVTWLFLAMDEETGLSYLVANQTRARSLSSHGDTFAGICLALPVAALVSCESAAGAAIIVLAGAYQGQIVASATTTDSDMDGEWLGVPEHRRVAFMQGAWSLGFVPVLGAVWVW